MYLCVDVCEIGYAYSEMLPSSSRAVKQGASVAISSLENLFIIKI